MIGYRWWTVSAGRDEYGFWLKAGPVTVSVYRWVDGGLRVAVIPLHWREFILWGGPLC